MGSILDEITITSLWGTRDFREGALEWEGINDISLGLCSFCENFGRVLSVTLPGTGVFREGRAFFSNGESHHSPTLSLMTRKAMSPVDAF